MAESPHGKRPIRGYTPELIEHIRRRYIETDETQRSIASDIGVTRKTLEKLAAQHGWPLRKNQPSRDLPPAVRLDLEAAQALDVPIGRKAPEMCASAGPSSCTPVSLSIADRLEEAVERELRRVESLRSQYVNSSRQSLEAERTARTLGSLTETLFKVRRLREPGLVASDEYDLPSDIDRFRHALAERMDAFVRGRADGGVSADTGSADATSPGP